MREKMNLPSWLGDLLLLITAIVWGGGFICVTESLNTLGPFYMIAIRFSIAALLMIMIFWKTFKQIGKKEIAPGIICGVMLFIGFAFQTTAAQYVSAGKLAFLTALNVVMVPFIAAFGFKEKIYRYNVIASIVAIIGFGFLNLSNESGITFGIGEVLGVMCAVGFAVHIAVLGHYTAKVDAIKLSILQMITCAGLGIICALVFEKPPTEITMKLIMPVTYLGVCSTFIGFLFQTIGQKYTSASRTAILLSMESVFGILLSILILKEKITFHMGIGAILIFAAVIIAEYMHARGTHEKNEKVTPKCVREGL